jgi:hypothetical protein
LEKEQAEDQTNDQPEPATVAHADACKCRMDRISGRLRKGVSDTETRLLAREGIKRGALQCWRSRRVTTWQQQPSRSVEQIWVLSQPVAREHRVCDAFCKMATLHHQRQNLQRIELQSSVVAGRGQHKGRLNIWRIPRGDQAKRAKWGRFPH